MDELIYQFLLKAGFPRAAIVTDTTLLSGGPDVPIAENASTFVVIDPESAERLAAIDVLGALTNDDLPKAAERVGRYAASLGGRGVQGFVVSVDAGASDEDERIRFFRVWPDPLIRRLSALTFPDLDSLRVGRRLAQGPPRPASDVVELVGRSEEGHAGAGGVSVMAYAPALLLLLLGVIDWYVGFVRGTAFVNASQAMLAVGAAVLFTLTAVARARRV